MKNKTIHKSQKPIDYEAHFKYECPEKRCGFTHWINARQAQTKGYKIVCDCGTVFRPKRIRNIKIQYATTARKEHKPTTAKQTEQKIVQEINIDFLSQCVKVLVNYGFTDTEAREYIISAYRINPINNVIGLIKFTLEQIGENNNGKRNSTNSI